ncbi:hypothetical protein [Gilliamella apis]|uniref:hypothetical protein n=1 Tax=Gilliamella apis TaxID=1970738 RepID=UPI00105441D4|nr:hypothetical protein [Gilliamella apis]MCT6868074.1 hypothetical protein [Gilliamella apicola]
MSKDKTLTIQCQISIDQFVLNKLQKFVIDKQAANDEVILSLASNSNYYSIKDIMKILNISTRKEVELLIKNLQLNKEKYRHLSANNEWLYNNDALNILKLYLIYKVA